MIRNKTMKLAAAGLVLTGGIAVTSLVIYADEARAVANHVLALTQTGTLTETAAIPAPSQGRLGEPVPSSIPEPRVAQTAPPPVEPPLPQQAQTPPAPAPVPVASAPPPRATPLPVAPAPQATDPAPAGRVTTTSATADVPAHKRVVAYIRRMCR